MRSSSPVSETTSLDPSDAPSDTRPAEHAAAPHATGHAAQGPMLDPVSAAENPAPAPSVPTDSPAEALGRRILSTAFVRVGPDAHLTVELRDGRVLVLRDMVMHARKYCGMQMSGGQSGVQYCGGYADVAAARPGGAPKPATADPTVSRNSPAGGE